MHSLLLLPYTVVYRNGTSRDFLEPTFANDSDALAPPAAVLLILVEVGALLKSRLVPAAGEGSQEGLGVDGAEGGLPGEGGDAVSKPCLPARHVGLEEPKRNCGLFLHRNWEMPWFIKDFFFYCGEVEVPTHGHVLPRVQPDDHVSFARAASAKQKEREGRRTRTGN